jgi:hypothetical protein
VYAYIHPRLDGQPWLSIDDARLLDDFDYGCTPFAMALRAKRSEDEVVQRLRQLGRSMASQPKGRKIRDITWSRRV